MQNEPLQCILSITKNTVGILVTHLVRVKTLIQLYIRLKPSEMNVLSFI